MKRLRYLVVGVVLLVMVVLLVIPALGKPVPKEIDNSNPYGFDVSPGLEKNDADFNDKTIFAGKSHVTVIVDPIHICGSGRGG